MTELEMKHGGNVWGCGEPEEWLDFSANLRPEGPPDWVRKAMARATARARFYPDRAMRAAREGLARFLGVSAARVLPTAGGAAAIDLALSLDAGRVLTYAPTFGEYAERAAAHGRQALHMAQNTKLFAGDTCVLCNPNNPTGRTMSRADVLSVKERVRDSGARLIVDEAFVDYCPEVSVRDCADAHMIVVGSLTKILAVPGARLGYALSDEETIRRMERLALPWSLNAWAAEIAAQAGGHIKQTQDDARRNAERRKRFSDMFFALGAKPLPSGASFLLVDFGRDMRSTTERLRARGILVRNCASFGLGENWLRLAVRTDEENERLIEAIREIWKDC